MLTVLGITSPIFALVALGYMLVAKGPFTSSDMRTLGVYVTNVALPPLIFLAVATRPVTEVMNLPYMGSYLIGGLATGVVAFLWFSRTTGPGRRGVGYMGATCPNSGFIGYPLLIVALPEIAGLTLAMNMVVENVILVPVALTMLELGNAERRATPWATFVHILLGVLKRPMVWGLIAGLAVSISGLMVPAPMERGLALLGNSAVAVSLIVMGGTLVGIPFKGNRLLAAQISAAKLLLFPAFTFLALLAFEAMGFALSPELRAAVLLSAGMPMFGAFTVFAQEVGHEGLAAIAQLLATAAAFVTLSVGMVLLGVG